jgi:hypothetical protein
MSLSSLESVDSDSDSDSDNDADDNTDNKKGAKKSHYLLNLLLLRRHNLSRRRPKFVPTRLVWKDYVSQLIHQNEFSVTFRMSLGTFNKLVEILREDLEVNQHQALRSSKRNGPILPELVVAMSLRWLAGGQWPDIKKVYGVSKGHFYRLRTKFMKAVVGSPTLEIWLPDSSDVEALQGLARQFEATASSPVLRGCVGALDGLTVFIKAPTASEAENVLAYYSGHYKHDSLNVQAMSDYRGKFLYFAVAAPGSFPDSKALALTRLKNWIDALPAGFYVVADNAYVISEHMLIPFSGTQRHVPENSSYNYFLSQLRIRVEQAFGQFSVKWRVIRKPLETSLQNSSLLLVTCARLHNFIIDNDWQQNNEEVTPADVVGNLNEIYRPNLTRFRGLPGTSFLRDTIIKHIEENGYRRPSYNRLRNDRSATATTTLNFEEYELMKLM